MEFALGQLSRMNPRLVALIEKRLRAVPSVKRKIESDYDGIMAELERSVKPYRDGFFAAARLPAEGRSRDEIIREMEALKQREESKWKEGFVSGAVYHGDERHIDFLNRVYAIHSQSNPLHSDVWPSAAKFESEIVAMTAAMLGGDSRTCGTVTSGGTESILLAMKTYRDWARETKGIAAPEIVAPVTAHVAFDKAAQYFRMKIVRTPIDSSCRADLSAVKRALNRNTVAIVGSAPGFPHGVIDPIPEMSELARERGIGFHTDACLGGFVLPWAERLGYPVPGFDFRLQGVTSISADTHKYGYAAKGMSVVLYRNAELRRHQYFTATDWPGGLYFSPTIAGSRPGALSAVCWAAMVTIGERGYMEATRKILETASLIKKGIAEIPELRLLGDPLWILSFASDSLDIYRVLDEMAKKKWALNGLHKPAAVHLALTLRHAQPGVAERFVEDLREAVAQVKAHPDERGGMAPVYGMAATLPLRTVVSDMLKRYIDLLYKV
ncbi:MAG: aspartate aminotransferase family protein [Chloroflexi bacterium]|nr:aspartate aminotransferase family protein [Chloroflexota bacterium]